MTFYFPLPEKVSNSKIVYDCEKCGLYKKEKLRNPIMEPFIGNKYNGLVIVGDKPSIDDDLRGIPLVNDKAKIVRSTFFKNRINLANESAMTYAACCQSYKVTDVQFKCCTDILYPRLAELKPKVIITLGDMAFKSVMGLKTKNSAFKIRNRIVPNFEFNCIVFPLLDPNQVNAYHYKYAIQRDIERFCKLWKNKYHKRTFINELVKSRKILEDITIHEVKPEEVERVFEEVYQMDKVALDYETTNVNPYDDFFEITHISFGLKSIAYVMHESLWENDPAMWETIKTHMVTILTNPNILKVIQNSKFEDLASRFIFGIKSIKNSFCTMLATHVVDERRGCTGLDFQNLVRFGIPPYSETVKQFLVPKSKDEKINTIRQAPHDDMITYAGLDVITTFNNFEVLVNEIMPHAYPQAFDNYEFLHKGHWVFANMSQRGIPIGEDEFSEIDTILDQKINEVLQEISEIPEFIDYNIYLKERGMKTKDGDKEIKELIEATKEGSDEDDELESRSNGENVRINRKISFN